jgi:hypothetical protein
MSLLSETFVHVLSASQTVADQLHTESSLPGQVNVSVAEFRVVPSPLAIGTYSVPLDHAIPSNAFVYASLMDTTVAFTSAGAATIGMGLASNNNLTGGIQQALGVWAIGLDKYTPVFVTTSETRVVTVNVAANNLITGAVTIHILWV